MTIHVAKPGEPSQQITVAEANQRLARGELSHSDLAWHDGLPKWVPLSQIRGIVAPANATSRPAAPSSNSPSGEWGQPVSRPAPSADGFWGGADACRLWNPNVSALWSIFFSAAFGGFLIARNWKTLGQPDRATKSTVWAVLTLLVLLANAILIATPLGSATGLWVQVVLLAILVLWYVTAAKEQVRYVEMNVRDYSKRGWAAPIGFALIGVVVLAGIAVGTSMLMGNRAAATPTVASVDAASSHSPNTPPAPPEPQTSAPVVPPAAVVAVPDSAAAVAAKPLPAPTAPATPPAAPAPAFAKASAEEEVRAFRRDLARKKLGRASDSDAPLTLQLTRMLDVVSTEDSELLLGAVENWDPKSRESFANLKATLAPRFDEWRDKYDFKVPLDKSCTANLRLLDAAIEQWALENKKPAGEFVVPDDLKPYLTSIPKCPDGGTYTFISVGERPTCSITEHNTP